MEKFLTFCHKALFLLCSVLFFSCHQDHWYKKEFTAAEKIKLSNQILAGDGHYYYQGSVPDQFMLDEALMYHPDNAAAWRERGTAYVKRGLAQEAMAYYGKAVELDPVEWQGWRGYLYLYLYRDYEKAIADFDATDTLTPDFTDYPQGQSVDYMRGLCYYGLKDYTTALRYFSKYIEEVTLDVDESWVDTYAFLYRGLTFEKLDNPDAALLDFNTALKYYPNLSDCFYHKSRIYSKMGDNKKAMVLLQEAKKFYSQDYFHQRPYVEVQEQIYLYDIELLEKEIRSDSSPFANP